MGYSTFVQVPDSSTLPAGNSDCGYVLTYTAKYRTFFDTLVDLPGFVVWDQASRQFEIFSDDEADLTTPYRTYSIELTASTSTLDQNPPAIHTQTFIVNVENGCLLDEVSVASTPWDSSYIYHLGGQT